MHRVDCKRILESNINLCNILMRILATLQVHFSKGKTEFTKLECKKLYMQRIDGYEKTDKEVMSNRLKLRNYIRELILNQHKVMEQIAKKDGGASIMEELQRQAQAQE